MEQLSRLVETYLRDTMGNETLEFAQHWVEIAGTLQRLEREDHERVKREEKEEREGRKSEGV